MHRSSKEFRKRPTLSLLHGALVRLFSGTQGPTGVRCDFDFSFSGLKTAVARWVETQQRDGVTIDVGDVAASFQEAVCDVLVRKAIDAATDQGIEDILIGGGVAANSRLRAMATERAGAPGDPGPGPATRPVHRQRRDGGRPRRRAGRPRPYAVRARPAGRLVPAGHRGRRLATG